VYTVRIDELELLQLWSDDDPAQRAGVTFPAFHATGAKSTAVVYFELDPGARIGSHTDSAEEILLILAGKGEATVGGEIGEVEEGSLTVVPALVPHDIENSGQSTLKVLGFFSSNAIVSVFGNAWQPAGAHVVGTPVPEEVMV
jgi:quercetin dioxygenase-like cupin family protein